MVGFMVLDSCIRQTGTNAYAHSRRAGALRCEMFEIFQFYQGKGYGEAAVLALREAAVKHESIELEPLDNNEGFWLKCGFTKTGPRCMVTSLVDAEPRTKRARISG